MRKSVLTGAATSVNISMPISKVDTEKRLVSGFASLDNVDQQGDRVLSNASVEAFQKFRGNIREQHAEHLAVGRLVNFEEQMYYDPESEKFLSGVYVTAYVSKGAQDTWEKVLDGTLSGFSIGGGVDDFVMDMDEVGNAIRTITKYHLTELSLVDNPANQLANILSIQKTATGDVLEGIAAEVETRTIFFCPTDKKALLAKGEKHDCPECGSQMECIGWCESTGADVVDDMKVAIEKRLSENREGGAVNDMTVEKEATAAETEEVEAVVEDDNAEQVDEATVEAAEPVVEGEPVDHEEDEAGEDLTDVIREFQKKILDAIAQGQDEQTEKVEELRKELGGIEDKFVSKLEELEKVVSKLENDQEELGKSFRGIQDSVTEVEKGLREVDPSTAIKKSVDTDQSAEEPVATSLWTGTFLNIDSL